MGDDAIKIGQLLVSAGILTDGKLNQRLDLARQLGLPLGQILIQSNDLAKEQLLNAIHVQSLVLENLITLETAVAIVRDMSKNGMSLDEALAKQGLADQHLTHRLGELLVLSGHLSEEKLSDALLSAGEVGIPLGHILIQSSVVAPDIVGIALTTQRQIRMKIMSTEEAVARLRNYQPAASSV